MKGPSPLLASLTIAFWMPSSDAEIITRRDTFYITQPEIAKTQYGMSLPTPETLGDREVMDIADRYYSGQVVANYSFDSETREFKSFTFASILANSEVSEIQIFGQEPPQIPPPVPLPPQMPYKLQVASLVDYPLPTPGLTYVFSQSLADPNDPFWRDHLEDYVILFRPETIVPVGQITPSGELDNSEHVFFTYWGTMITRHVVDSKPQVALTADWRPIPTSNPGPSDLPMKGTFTPSISVIASRPTYRTMLALLTIELDERDPVTLRGAPEALSLEVEFTEVGTFSANTVLFNVPTAYGNWAIENGLSSPDPDDTNSAGIAYGILFAMDLPATTTTLPISVDNSGPEPLTRISLPAGGLLNPIYVEYSSDLKTSPWPKLPAANYVDGPDSLDSGATGSPRFRYPDGDLGFMRFATDLPE
jgi:hypothetical protein